MFAFGGDVHFEGVARRPSSPARPRRLLAPIEPVLDEADIAVVNLETAVTNSGAAASKTFVFRTPASAFAALRGGSVDVASMANNHGMDYGEAGLRDSLAAARRYRFPVIGIGLDGKRAYAPYRGPCAGQRIAVLAATQVLDDHLIDELDGRAGQAGARVGEGRPAAACRRFGARAGPRTRSSSSSTGASSSSGCPTSDQRTLARQLVGAGADIVVGGHAHRLLGAGRMGKALVGLRARELRLVRDERALDADRACCSVTATGRRIDGYRWVPARIVDGVPRPLSGDERRHELAAWRSLRGCTALRP